MGRAKGLCLVAKVFFHVSDHLGEAAEKLARPFGGDRAQFLDHAKARWRGFIRQAHLGGRATEWITRKDQAVAPWLCLRATKVLAVSTATAASLQ